MVTRFEIEFTLQQLREANVSASYRNGDTEYAHVPAAYGRAERVLAALLEEMPAPPEPIPTSPRIPREIQGWDL